MSALSFSQTAWKYAEDVLDGTVPTCHYIKAACQKAVDMKSSGQYVYDETAAERPILFAQYCKHLKGPLAGQHVVFEPWQLFLICQIYGWFRPDGRRVCRTVYIEVPRKNGKSTLCSLLALYHLLADNEASAEVYAAAVTRDQARIVFNDAAAMVRGSSDLAKHLGVHKSNIFHLKTNSKFEPLSSDAGSLEGKNPSYCVVDELHVHKTPEVWDVLNVASGARAQPIIFGITTAGTNQEGIAYQLRDYAIKTCSGIVEDDTFFSLIYTMDKEDDWRDPEVWIKANPNYNVSVQPDDLERLFKQAVESPSAETNFRTKRLNEWRNATAAWISTTDWEACDTELPALDSWRGQPCYIGLDLASVSDFACVSLQFVKDGKVYNYVKSYLPEDTVFQKSGAMGEHYRDWRQQGRLVCTEGNVTDLSYIKADVLKWCELFNVREIAFDPYGANELSADLLDKGLPMVKFGQGIASMSGPSKSFEKLIKSKNIVHGGDPVLKWMVSNCVIYIDPNDNIKVKKETHANKIDGVIASIMALARLEINGGLKSHAYETRGIRTL